MTSAFRPFQVLPVLVLMAACLEATQPRELTPDASLVRIRDCDGPATSLDPAIAATLPRRTGRMIPDDQWADLAATVPGGFAGVLYVKGRPVLMLTDPTKEADAKKALAAAIPGFDVAGAEVHKARWDFAQLVDWYNYLMVRTAVWQTPRMASGDKDEAINRIHYGVVDAAARDRLIQTLAGIELPCDLIAIKITGAITLAK